MPVVVQKADSAKPQEKPFRPRGAARELMRCTDREVLLAGPAGTGKSRACLEKLNLIAMQMPIRGAIVRKVRHSLTQSAMITFEQRVLPVPSGVRWHDGSQEYRYPNGAVIMVSGLDDPDKVGSTEFDVIYVQEATELDEEDWGMLLRGLRNGVLGYQQLIADCNPTYPDHWLKQRCNDGRVTLFDSKHEDNPLLFDDDGNLTEFGRGYIGTLDSLKGYQYQRLRLGMWVAAQGMYFQEWDPLVHICEPFDVPDEWPRWIAVDYGFSAPFCCLWLTRSPETRRVYVYREAYGAGLRDEQQAQLILDRTGSETLALKILDPSMFNQRSEQQRPSIAAVYAGLGLEPVTPGMNSRKQGWAILRRALAHDQGEPRLQIMKDRAPNLVRTLPTLVMDSLDPEDVADTLHGGKTEDHAADALRYGMAAEAQPAEPQAALDFVWA